MTELTETQPEQKSHRLHAFTRNPITIKELRSRMRGRRAFVVLTIYLLAMSTFLSLVYLAYASSSGGPYGPDPRNAGQVVFATVLGIQAFLVIFIGPSFTAGAISGEKERQTFDLLRTTLLTAKSFVLGKLISALSYVFLLILAAIPLQSIAFLLGGVSPLELFLSQLLVMVAAVTFAMFGLFCSSAMRSTLAASAATFAGSLFLTIGIPVLVMIMAMFLGPIMGTSLSGMAELMLVFGGLALAATNLPATLILSEMFLLEENALFYFKTTIGGYSTFIVSPWPFFLLFYSLLTLLLYWLCVRKVRKIADK